MLYDFMFILIKVNTERHCPCGHVRRLRTRNEFFLNLSLKPTRLTNFSGMFESIFEGDCNNCGKKNNTKRY